MTSNRLDLAASDVRLDRLRVSHGVRNLVITLSVLVFVIGAAGRIVGPSDLDQNADQSLTMSFTVDMVLNGNWMLPRDMRGIVSRIRDRRFVAVDRERGIVFAFAFFDHEQINWTWQLAELFKIENGLIRRVEAVFHRAPYGTPSGWSTFEQAMSESIQSVR